MLSLSQLVADWDSHEASMQSVRATIRFAEDSILSIRAEQEECGRDIIEEMDRAGEVSSRGWRAYGDDLDRRYGWQARHDS